MAGGVFSTRVQATLQDFVETPPHGGPNVAVVTFENYWQEDDKSLARRLPWPRTTWILNKGHFYTFLLKNSAADKSTVAIVASLRTDWRQLWPAVRTGFDRAFVRWIMARDNLTISHSREPALVLPACLAGLSQKERVSHDVPNCTHRGSPLVYDYQPQKELRVFKISTKKTSLSDKVMKIGCLRSKQFPDGDICTLYSYLFDILRTTNISLVYRDYSHLSTLFDDLYCEKIDMVVLIMPVNNIWLAASTYSDIILLSETFYAPENEMEAPSLYDTALRSALAFAVTAASLIICVGLLLLIGGPLVNQRAQTETLFLLALFLARSTPFPNATRWPRVQNIVYLFWALAMLPLSQYFQGELTSLVTVGRPPNNLDTLQELEAALDAGVAAPCVPNRSASWDGIMNRDHTTTLGKKLRASLLENRHKLVTGSNLRSCMKCATRNRSVCYAHRMHSSLLKIFPDPVVAFEENFMTRAYTMPLRKSFPFRDAYRAFLQRVRESGLLSSPDCTATFFCTRSSSKDTTQTEKPLFELHGFFVFYVMLLAGTVGVLAAEILFARFYKSMFRLRFIRNERPRR
ncbi:hypothetical protein MTO96_041505 [Rhipicephalus appendiculatus]